MNVYRIISLDKIPGARDVYSIHWRRQLWGTGARAPSTSNLIRHFRAAQTLYIRLHVVICIKLCTANR